VQDDVGQADDHQSFACTRAIIPVCDVNKVFQEPSAPTYTHFIIVSIAQICLA